MLPQEGDRLLDALSPGVFETLGVHGHPPSSLSAMVPHLELGLFRRGLPERLGRTYHRGMTLVDLSQPIYAGMPRIHVLPEVDFQPVRRIDQGHPLNISELRIATHAGTH